ncbi:hypothetical protein PESHB4_01360 [Pediococcus ethanolidurans]
MRVSFSSANTGELKYSELYKERLICKNCKNSIMSTADLVNKYCHISKATKQKIFVHFQNDRTQTIITLNNCVLPRAIGRYLNNYDELFR